VNDSGGIKKGSVTERLASNRQTKYNDLWMELLSKISELNQVFIYKFMRQYFYSFFLIRIFYSNWKKSLENVIHIMRTVIKVKKIVFLYLNLFSMWLELNDLFQGLIYQKEITSLTIDSFENAFNQLNQILPIRLSHIQELCQNIEELELNRIQQVFIDSFLK
jgi:hypothetical protein